MDEQEYQRIKEVEGRLSQGYTPYRAHNPDVSTYIPVEKSRDYYSYMASQNQANDDYINLTDVTNMGKSLFNGFQGLGRAFVNNIRAAYETTYDFNKKRFGDDYQGNYYSETYTKPFVQAALNSTLLTPLTIEKPTSTFGRSKAGQLALGVSSGIGQLGSNIIASAINPYVGAAAMATQVFGQQYEELREKGVDPMTAANAGVQNAIMQTPFEYIGFSKISKAIPKTWPISKKAKEYLLENGTEALTEFIQQFPEEYTNLVALNPNASREELQEMAKNDFGKWLSNATEAGIIGFMTSAVAGGVKLKMDKRYHDSSIEYIDKAAAQAKDYNATPEVVAFTQNADLQGRTAMVDSEQLQQYFQENTGKQQEIEQCLGVTKAQVDEAVAMGEDLDVMIGNLTAMQSKDSNFTKKMGESISFSEGGYMPSREAQQKELQQAMAQKIQTDEAFNATIENLGIQAQSQGAKKVTKQTIQQWKKILEARAVAYNPYDKMAFFRDHPLSVGKDGRVMMQQNVLNQLAGVDKRYRGTDKWMKAPNGQPTSLTEDQWKLTQTDAFKTWFGNSKLVDKNGEPLVMYHQTGNTFTTFDVSRDTHSPFEYEAPYGVFTKPDASDIGFNGKIQMPLYVRANNPIVFKDRAEILEYLKKNVKWYGDLYKDYQKYLDEGYAGGAKSSARAMRDQLTKYLKKQGYDAVRILKDEGSDGRVVEATIVLDPNQVKSAVANNGDFSLTDNNIYHQEQLQQTADKVIPNTVELNAVSVKDERSREYLRKVLPEKYGMTTEEVEELLRGLNAIVDEVMDITKGYAIMTEWQMRNINDPNLLYRVFNEKYKATFGAYPTRSAFKKNGEYELNFDLGSLCTKRESMDAIIQILTDEGFTQQLGPTQMEALKSMLKSEGFLTACDVCFVETKRVRALNDANKWTFEWKSVLEAAGINDGVLLGTNRTLSSEQLTKLNEMAGNVSGVSVEEAYEKYMPEANRRTKNKKTDLDTGITSSKMQKIAKLMLEDNSLAGEFKTEWLLTTKGTDWLMRNYAHTNLANTLASMYGAATAKPLEGFNIYDHLSWEKDFDSKNINKKHIYDIGGFRAQSFTDFNPILFVDYVQMFVDLQARQLPIHLYTKVPALIELFGRTGAMFNMSFVPEIVDGATKENAGLKKVNGKWEYAWAKESFPIDKALELRQREDFGGRVGTIAVGVSDKHIEMMLDDETIDMVIPYHKSGMAAAVQIKTGLKYAHDYTNEQTTKKPKNWKENPEDPEYSFDHYMQQYRDARAAANAYLEWCKRNKCTPMFEKFSKHKNYYKLLENFRSYDNNGNPVVQGPVSLKLTDNWQDVLKAALEDRAKNADMTSALKSANGTESASKVVKGKSVLQRARDLLKYQKLDGEVREIMVKRLKSALGKNNVETQKNSIFLDGLQKAYAASMGETKAAAMVETFRNGEGIVYGYAVGNKIILNEDVFNANTPAHEFTHVWSKVAQISNPKLWAQGVELLKQDETWQAVVNDPLYQNIAGNENAIASEVLSRIVGQENEEYVRKLTDPTYKMAKNKGLREKIKAWAQKLFQEVRSLFDTKNTKELTYDEFIHMPLKTLWDESKAQQFGSKLKAMNLEGDMVAKPMTLTEMMAERKANEDNELTTDLNDKKVRTQIEEVRKRYQGTTQWMKAPNGKPSNLTETQWLYVRTDAFKEKYGDWEYAVQQQKFQKQKPVLVNAEGIKKLPDVSQIESAVQAFKQQYPNGTKVDTVIGEVVIDGNSLKNSLSHKWSEAKYQTCLALKDGMEVGSYLGSLPDLKGNKDVTNNYFTFKIEFKGQDLIALCRVKSAFKHNRLYLHEVASQETIKKWSKPISWPPGKTQVQLRGIALYASIINQFANHVNKINIALDENQEPVISKLNDNQYLQGEGAPTANGGISWDGAGAATIELMKTADASTLIHETGHYFVEALINDVINGRASEQQIKDVDALMRYCGITLEQWQAMNFNDRRQYHEKLAEAFETYFMEGKTPAMELRNIFVKFRDWLTSIYKNRARSGNAKDINDEVRAVFDHMLASQEEIAEMERVEGYFAKMPKVVTDNLSPQAQKMLENGIIKAHDKAVNLLTANAMQNFSKDRKDAIKAYRDEIVPEITEELQNTDVYQASAILRENSQDGKTRAKTIAKRYTDNKLTDEEKASFDVLAESLGFSSGSEMAQRITEMPSLEAAVKARADEMVQQKFPDVMQERAMAEQAAREALYNDESATLVAVETVLIEEELAKAKAKSASDQAKERMDNETKRQAQEEHQAEVEAKKAERKAESEKKKAETKAATKERSQRVAYVKSMMEMVGKDDIEHMTLSDALKLNKYISAERNNAAKAAVAMSKKDYETALKYKRLQAYNHVLVINSLRIKKEFDRGKKVIAAMKKSKRKDWVSQLKAFTPEETFLQDDHFNQMCALLGRLGVNRKDYEPNMRVESLAEYASRMNELYDNVDIAPWILRDENMIGLPRDLTIIEFNDVVNALRNIRAIAKAEQAQNAFETGRAYEEVKADIIAQLEGRKDKWTPNLNKQDQTSKVKTYFAGLQNSDTFFEKMDKWTYGFFTKLLYEPEIRCNDREVKMNREFQEAIGEAYKEWCPDNKAEQQADAEIYYNELGASVNKHVLVNMLIYLGSESSAAKLVSNLPTSTFNRLFPNNHLVDYSTNMVLTDKLITDDLVESRKNAIEFLGQHLTQEDIAYADKMVKAFNMYWEELASLEKETKGFRPKKVEAVGIQLKLADGSTVYYGGGYAPLVRFRDAGSRPISQEQLAGNTRGAGIKTMHTNQGASKSRDASVYPIDLRKGSAVRGVQDTIHDICYRKYIADIRKLINDEEVYNLIKRKVGLEDMQVLEEWMKRCAQPYEGGYTSLADEVLGGSLGWLRSRTVNAAIVGNIKTSIQNLGNFFLYGNTVEGFTYADTVKAITNYFNNTKGMNDVDEFVFSKSEFMRERSLTPDISIRDIREGDVFKHPYQKKLMDFGAQMLTFTDNMTAVPVWVQAYQKKISQGATDQEAVAFADTVIRRTMGSSRITDVAPLQRGSSLAKLLTTFQGFFITQFNQWQREAGLVTNLWADGKQGEALRSVFAFALSKWLMVCLANVFLGLEVPWEKEKDGMPVIVKEMIHYPASMTGPAGSVINATMDQMIGLQGFGYRMTVAEGSINTIMRTFGTLGKAVKDKKYRTFEGIAEPVTGTVGLYYGVPSQFNKLCWNAYDIVFNHMHPRLNDLIKRRPKNERNK